MSETLAIRPGIRAMQAKQTTVDELEGLIDRIVRGDDTALEPFIDHTRDYAFRLAYSFLRDSHRCEDVLQDVYLIVYRQLGQLRDRQAFRTWFGRIIANRCRRLLREQPAQPLEEAPEPSSEGPARQVEDRLTVRQALAELGEQDRTVLSLREMLALTYEEIASVLEVPVGTVRSRLAKARQRLYAVLMEKKV
ncbi:MAG: RNA polymerase sigma factor [Vulcanimicrobiota bacterium]